jgi:integrase/recombinase XerC
MRRRRLRSDRTEKGAASTGNFENGAASTGNFEKGAASAGNPLSGLAREMGAAGAASPLSGLLPDARELLRLFYLGRPALTIDAYSRDLQAFAAFTGAPDVEHAVTALLSLPKHAADALVHEWKSVIEGAPATRARRLATLRGLVKMAERFGMVTWKLDVRDPPVEKFKDTEGPGIEAIEAMLRAADGLAGRHRLRARAVLLLIATLGLRRDEVAKLRVGGFDERRRKLYVVGKNKREVLLSVPEITAQALQEWLASLEHREPSDFIFQRLDKPGTGVTGQSIYKVIAALGERAGVRTWPHGLRHTAVTEVTRANGLVAASKFARHREVKTTMIYQDRIENLAGVGAETMARLLGEK